MATERQESADAFQPGQLGTRHLLGAITVAAVILGISATRLRTMGPMEIVVVCVHWVIVLGITVGTFVVKSRLRRYYEENAGQLLVTAMCRPMTARGLMIRKWLLTTLVVLDGVFISLVPYTLPVGTLPQSGFTYSRVAHAVLRGAMPQMAFWEGALWAWCLSHWLTNVYRVEFREHGLLMYSGFCPWKGMTRLGWSTFYPNRLIFFQRGVIVELSIDPASREAVNDVLQKVRAGALH